MTKPAMKRSIEVAAVGPVPTTSFLVKRVKGEDSDSVDSGELDDDKQVKITKAIRTILEV